MKRATDGEWATADDAHDATVAQAWSAITYVALGEKKKRSRGPPSITLLLYLDVPDPSDRQRARSHPVPDTGAGLANERTGHIHRPSEARDVLVIDGIPATVATDHVAGLGHMFAASSVAVPAGSAQQVTLYTPNRYVF